MGVPAAPRLASGVAMGETATFEKDKQASCARCAQRGLSAKRVAPARRKLDTTSFQQRRGDLQQWRIAAAAKASHLPSLCSLLSTAGA